MLIRKTFAKKIIAVSTDHQTPGTLSHRKGIGSSEIISSDFLLCARPYRMVVKCLSH